MYDQFFVLFVFFLSSNRNQNVQFDIILNIIKHIVIYTCLSLMFFQYFFLTLSRTLELQKELLLIVYCTSETLYLPQDKTTCVGIYLNREGNTDLRKPHCSDSAKFICERRVDLFENTAGTSCKYSEVHIYLIGSIPSLKYFRQHLTFFTQTVKLVPLR